MGSEFAVPAILFIALLTAPVAGFCAYILWEMRRR